MRPHTKNQESVFVQVGDLFLGGARPFRFCSAASFLPLKRSLLVVLILVSFLGSPGHAATYYWNSIGTSTWSSGTSWSTVATGVGGTGAGPASTSDIAVFNGSSFNGTTTAQIAGPLTVGTLTFNNTGAPTLESSSSTAETLTLGTTGITIAAGAGPVTIGNATNTLNIALAGNDTWTNNSTANTFTVLNGITSSAASSTQTLFLAGAGNISLSGIIGNGSSGGTVALTSNSTSVVTLGGANTYTGRNDDQ